MFDNNSRVLIRNCHPQLIIMIIKKKKKREGGLRGHYFVAVWFYSNNYF